ncbi:UPF0149 family protein [Pseudoalteromonas sp. T1lg65]|uniref:UPF0149 family protein n=1 Tax=Pseudoalteromonas sp. T1lg65 TaxID=2077101 RepID=UPI003F7B0F0E
MYQFNFTEEHLACIENYLQAHALSTNFAFLQGYLFAVSVSPDGIEVEQWLNVITHNDDSLDEQVAFALMALHHQITEAVYQSGFSLPWNEDTCLSEKESWCEGFLMGAMPFYEKLMASSLDDELKQALSVSTEQLGFFSLGEQQLQAFCTQTGQDLEHLVQQQSELAEEFAPAYAELVEAAAVASGLYD